MFTCAVFVVGNDGDECCVGVALCQYYSIASLNTTIAMYCFHSCTVVVFFD